VAQHSSDLHQLIIAAAIALALMAVVSLALGWLVASHFLVPLRAITSTTRDISATNLHERLNIAGPDDEIKELADTFDDLLERLEQAFDFERQFVANASHELRTPLATMRASLDVAMAKPGPLPPPMTVLDERLRRELDHVDRLLDSFLSLARARRGPATDEAVVSLDEAVATAVDNAVNHNEPGGWLRAQTSSDGAFVRVVVENGGAVLAQDDVNELARPFRRLDAERTGSERGSGLGLSIVRSIAEAHGGALELQARDGGGLRVVITLPRAQGSTVGTPA
jgi:signal transduction histidine kinase